MKNVYDGVMALDESGEAVVELPDWFEALNRDFRYQLTAIGGPAPNLHIAEEVNGNRFRIAGGGAGMKVSWMVTGIRQDAWANANRIQVESAKADEECRIDRGLEPLGFQDEPGLVDGEDDVDLVTPRMAADAGCGSV